MPNDNAPKSPADPNPNPAQRLSQVAGHVSSSSATKKRSPKGKISKDVLPADYSDILGQLDKLRTIASTPDRANKGYVRQKQAGKLWVRERVLALLDEGSFREVGCVYGTVEW
jgi:hypothetical protein